MRARPSSKASNSHQWEGSPQPGIMAPLPLDDWWGLLFYFTVCFMRRISIALQSDLRRLRGEGAKQSQVEVTRWKENKQKKRKRYSRGHTSLIQQLSSRLLPWSLRSKCATLSIQEEYFHVVSIPQASVSPENQGAKGPRYGRFGRKCESGIPRHATCFTGMVWAVVKAIKISNTCEGQGSIGNAV